MYGIKMNWKLPLPRDGSPNCFYEKTFLASQAMNGFLSGFTLSLPEWLVARFTELPECFTTAEERMRLILELARRNALEDSGGPFAAGVFEYDTGRLVAVGVNRVVPANCSSAHAEVMAAGDAAFIEKARRRMNDLVQRANILVFASHSLEMLPSFCARTIFLNRGEIVADGPTQEVIQLYRNMTAGGTPS
jgi:hypothetical protein